MFCSQCGAKASGKFCSECGAPITNAAPPEAQKIDWADDIRYEELMRIPEIRDLIQNHAGRSKKGMSGEEFLGFCDKAFSPLEALSLQKVGAIVQPITERLGLKTGKTRSRSYDKPPGKILVSLLCSLARHGQELRQVSQGEDGCVLEASIPSDMWSFEGVLLATVRREGTGTHVEAGTIIKGQLFDGVKSKRQLEELLSDLDMTPAFM